MNKHILFAIMILAGCEGRVEVEKIVTVTETDTVLVEVCKCSDGTTTDCEASACPGETVREYVCQINGEVVSDSSECPVVGEGEGEDDALGSLTFPGVFSDGPEVLILGNSLGNEAMTIIVQARSRDFRVDHLTILVLGNHQLASSVHATWVPAGASPVDYATVSTPVNESGYANFAFPGVPLVVPADDNVLVTFSVDVNPLDPAGGLGSGSEIQLAFLGIETDAFQATELSSGRIVTEHDIGYNMYGPNMIVRKTKPTISLASGSPSGAGVPGLAEVLRFNVAADSRGFIQFDRIAFKVFNTGFLEPENGLERHPLSFDNRWRLVDIDDPSINLLEPDELAVTGGGGVTPIVQFLLDNDPNMPSIEVGAGETRTFSVQLDTSGAITDDMVQLEIPSEDEVPNSTLNGVPNSFAFRWNDDVEAQDIDGSLVKNLPVNGGTIVY